jgi:hypothetical protein
VKKLVSITVSVFLLGCHPRNVSQRPASWSEELAPLAKKVEELRSLAFKSPVPIGRRSQAEIRKYLEKRIAEEYTPEGLENEKRVYVLLGLFMEDFPYRETVLKLLSSQIAGYYDPSQKTLLIANRTTSEELNAIAVHELTHALQDQHFDLLSLMKKTRGNDDRTMALNAILEGEAMSVMTDYSLQGQGHAPEYSPAFIAAMKKQMMQVKASDSDLKDLPKVLMESLLYPYTDGYGFIQFARQQKGWEGVNQLFADLPESSEQILHPEIRGNERGKPISITGYTGASLASNVMGEFGIRSMLATKLSDSEAESAASGWGGDRYWLKTKTALLWVTEWDTVNDAEEFERAWKKANLQTKSSLNRERKRVSIGIGMPATN